VNDAITDPVEKTKVYDHVMSEMSSEKKTFAPRTFIEEYVPKAHRESFESFLKERQVSLKQFPLDTSEIVGRLRRRSYHTAKGAEVRVPEEEADIVRVQEESIIIADTVTRVDHK